MFFNAITINNIFTLTNCFFLLNNSQGFLKKNMLFHLVNAFHKLSNTLKGGGKELVIGYKLVLVDTSVK